MDMVKTVWMAVHSYGLGGFFSLILFTCRDAPNPDAPDLYTRVGSCFILSDLASSSLQCLSIRDMRSSMSSGLLSVRSSKRLLRGSRPILKDSTAVLGVHPSTSLYPNTEPNIFSGTPHSLSGAPAMSQLLSVASCWQRSEPGMLGKAPGKN